MLNKCCFHKYLYSILSLEVWLITRFVLNNSDDLVIIWCKHTACTDGVSQWLLQKLQFWHLSWHVSVLLRSPALVVLLMLQTSAQWLWACWAIDRCAWHQIWPRCDFQEFATISAHCTDSFCSIPLLVQYFICIHLLSIVLSICHFINCSVVLPVCLYAHLFNFLSICLYVFIPEKQQWTILSISA